jgi:phosphoribosylformylglycinamidine cyclo-ligase
MSKYADAGVSLDTAEEARRRIAELVRNTRTALARGKVGGFGGMVRMPDGYKEPVLVMSTDGVGTKVLVAAAANVHDTVGEDLVNHAVNDILVHGATPLAFLDYIATGNLVPEVAAGIVSGIARACRAHDMTLAGGETAQLPDLYVPGLYDLAGTIVGVVEESQAIHGDRVAPGDQLIGYASTGLHTNGYTLARKIVFEYLQLSVHDPFPEMGQTVAQALLAVHRSYAATLKPILNRAHALAHITGGGIPGNLTRVLPPARKLWWTQALAVAAAVPGADAGRARSARRNAPRVQSWDRDDRGRARDDVEAAPRGRAHERRRWLIGEIRAASRKPHASAVRFEER